MTARSPIEVTREQILAYRRHVGGLNERLPMSADSLRRAAWAGLQDSMPRAAVLSIHARVRDTQPDTWDDPALAQLWGPRYSVYAVPAQDVALFSLGRWPDDARGQRVAREMADAMVAVLGDATMRDRDVARALGVHNAIRYAATTGRILIRWEGARAPTIWAVPAPDVNPFDARVELARRYLHIFGPTRAEAFAEWAGIGPKQGRAAFEALSAELTAVRTPIGDGWILSEDEPTLHAAPAAAAPAQLLPSGDAYWLLQGVDRDLLVPDPARQAELWTPRVWPGALMVNGEIVGTWRRAMHVVSAAAWRKLSNAERLAVEAEAASLPLPGLQGKMIVRWESASGSA